MRSPTLVEKTKKQTKIMLLIIGGILYLFFAYFFFQFFNAKAKYPKKDFAYVMDRAMDNAFKNPSAAFPPKKNAVSILLAVTAMGAIVGVMKSSDRKLRKHDNPDTVNGEARFMTTQDVEQYSMKFAAPFGKKESDGPENMILSKEIKLAIDNMRTRRNCNVLAIGGSGAGKTRFFAGPNILQYNSNFVITDPSGELLRDYGKALEDEGYNVKVFNIVDVYKSSRYNPFHYIKSEKDVFILVETLIKNTNPSEGKSGDPFWENSERLLISALVLYIWHVLPYENQSFSTVMKLIEMADIDENDDKAQSPLDMLFEDLEKNDAGNLAVRQYRLFKKAAGKTLKSILISVGVRLQSFQLSDMQYLTDVDEMNFESFADTKQALFVIIPTADDTFNFIVSLLYSQLFMSLYDYCETRANFGWQAYLDNLNIIKVEQAFNEKDSLKAKAKIEHFIKCINENTYIEFDEVKALYKVYTDDPETGEKILVGWRGTEDKARAFKNKLSKLKIRQCRNCCPNHVRFILDEFANIGQIPKFDKKLSTIRKYEISCAIIVQALSQLKEIYEKKWNTIVANCDSKILLGCDDPETNKWMVEMLGKKTTIVENTSWQGEGQGSTSYNRSSQDLITIDQIGLMQDDECIVRIRGNHPYYGKKYELTQHPNYKEAIKKKGTFIIPISDAVKNRVEGPYWMRRLKEDNSNISLDSKVKEVVSSKTRNDDKTSSDNYARKMKSNKARTDAGKIKNDEPVDNTADLFAAFNLSSKDINNMDDDALKEAIESHILLESISTEEIDYYETA